MDQESKRLELQTLLEALLDSAAVYFQPPEDAKMDYPCITYLLDDIDAKFAGNLPYRLTRRYQVTSISSDPTSTIPDKLARLPQCTFQRNFTVDNLYHFVYALYF